MVDRGPATPKRARYDALIASHDRRINMQLNAKLTTALAYLIFRHFFFSEVMQSQLLPLILHDEDSSSEVEAEWRKINTLDHYKVGHA